MNLTVQRDGKDLWVENACQEIACAFVLAEGDTQKKRVREIAGFFFNDLKVEWGGEVFRCSGLWHPDEDLEIEEFFSRFRKLSYTGELPCTLHDTLYL